MNFDQYDDIQKDEGWQKATADGKAAVKTFVKAVKRRMEIEKEKIPNAETDCFFSDSPSKAAMTAFYFFKWLAQCEDYDIACYEKKAVPIIVVWQNTMGEMRYSMNINSSLRDPRRDVIMRAKMGAPILLHAAFDCINRRTKAMEEMISELMESGGKLDE